MPDFRGTQSFLAISFDWWHLGQWALGQVSLALLHFMNVELWGKLMVLYSFYGTALLVKEFVLCW